MSSKYTYEKSGVNIKKADEIIKNVQSKFKIENFKNFSGVLNSELFKGYSLVSCCDGIGSKIIPLIKYNLPNIIANDVVAMNLNDLITTGAKPLFFLDYIAVNNLKTDIIQKTIENLFLILKDYNCALLGGEISELKDLIKENCFDIAGFMVGLVEEKSKLSLKNVKKGDTVVAFPSFGIHSNGFSLIRKLNEDKKISDEILFNFLKPTKIYYNIVQKLTEKKLIKTCANITGGGILANLKRIIQQNQNLKLDFNSIPKQEEFEILSKFVENKECFNVFNMGVGFCVICAKNDVDSILKITKEDNPFVFGEVI